MTLHALDDVGDAVEATRALLWPPDGWLWAKLAFVVFFVGGGVNPLQFGGNARTGGVADAPDVSGAGGAVPSLGGAELAVIAAVLALVVAVGLLFVFVGSVMEFVFVASLRSERAAIRRYWRAQWRRGLRLFGFRLALGALSVGTIGLLIAAVASPALLGLGGVSLALVALAVPLAVVLVVVAGLVHGFTTAFVVPIMLVEDRGLLAAWRRFWPTLTGQWKQYAAYVVASAVLQVAGGVAASVVTAVGALVVAIPAGVVGLLGVVLLSVVPAAGWAVVAVAALLFVLAVLSLVALTAVPVQTFLRYYALLVLGDTNEAFDAIPERRRAVRE